MKNFFIIHGSQENSKQHWYPWVKSELEKAGYECIVPDFPFDKEEKHHLDQWYEVLNKYKEKITPETIFIGHSRGNSFVLNLLTDFDYKIDSLYMVGAFVEYFWQEEGQHLDSFFAKPFNYEKIKQQCKHFINYYSDNDEYIELEHFKKISKLLNARDVFIKGQGHFTIRDGYSKFEVLVKDILNQNTL